ncbi:MAG: hypothetical protein IB617_02470 [Candidatus Nealsonbacteria bacterium]|nr:MAG: hypothetical protein IB617_02470 [Candidatus Nealsonbacteria bacterium]
MLRSNLKQKKNPLPIAIITTVSFFIAFSLVKYLRHGQFDLIESLIGALVFFVVYFFLQGYLNKRIEKKQR